MVLISSLCYLRKDRKAKHIVEIKYIDLRGYHTLQVDNSFKSVERFDHVMFACKFQASRLSKPQREKLICG